MSNSEKSKRLADIMRKFDAETSACLNIFSNVSKNGNFAIMYRGINYSFQYIGEVKNFLDNLKNGGLK